jgi:putative ABC transport system permease protein
VDKPAVSHGYFGAMGIRLMQGRDFSALDAASGERVAIVSRSAARLIAANGEVIGKRVTLESQPRPEDWMTVVGIVDDVKQWGPALSSRPAIYQPYWQVRRSGFLNHMSYVVRTTSNPAPVIPALRASLSAVDANQPRPRSCRCRIFWRDRPRSRRSTPGCW